jgi:cation diffusion facilitator family transporter
MKSKVFLYVSLSVDALIAISKFVAALFTRSSSMVSEGIHSVIDAVSQILLLWGVKVSKKKADEDRPFGYGRELYFWSFVVSLMIFSLGGCISFYEGILHLKNPISEGNPNWNYGILLFAFVFNLISMFSALRAFNRLRSNAGFWKAVFQSKDPSTIIVLLGDFGDLLGLLVAFLALYMGQRYHKPSLDGIGSIIIGLILVSISAILINVSKGLLLGETISKKNLVRLVILVESDEAVVKVKKHFSTYMSPEEIILQLNTVFKNDLTTEGITQSVSRITRRIQSEFPFIRQVFITPVEK